MSKLNMNTTGQKNQEPRARPLVFCFHHSFLGATFLGATFFGLRNGFAFAGAFFTTARVAIRGVVKAKVAVKDKARRVATRKTFIFFIIILFEVSD